MCQQAGSINRLRLVPLAKRPGKYPPERRACGYGFRFEIALAMARKRVPKRWARLIQNSGRTNESAAAREYPLVAALKGSWTQFVHGIRRAHLRREAIRDLQRLNTHLLRDIGLEPMEIEACAAQMAATMLPAPEAAPRAAHIPVGQIFQ